jgi:hypothetical protein
MDRDLNAAINLARLGDHTNSGETGTGTGSRPAASVAAGDGRGAIQKTSPTTTAVGTAGADEASTPHTTYPVRGPQLRKEKLPGMPSHTDTHISGNGMRLVWIGCCAPASLVNSQRCLRPFPAWGR